MIKLCENSDEFLNICEKLKEIKGTRLTGKVLYTSMVAGLYNNQIFTYVSYDNDKMNGCLILLLAKDQIGELTMTLFFIWIDAHYPNLLKEFLEYGDIRAKELNIKKIMFSTGRKESIVTRRMGKYGFSKTYSTYIKEVI